MNGFGGIFKVLALLFMALFNPEGVKAAGMDDDLAKLLGFDDAGEMDRWRDTYKNGNFSDAFKGVHWGRIDQGKIEQQFGKYEQLLKDSKNPLLELIGKHESGGDYNNVYGRNKNHIDVNFTNMTIGEVLEWQRQYTSKNGPYHSASSAVGKYQFIESTLRTTAGQAGISLDTKFTPEVQDRLALQLLQNRGLDDYVHGRISEAQFVTNVSKEWASMPKDASGRSFYEGDGLNHAGTGVENVIAAARVIKAHGGVPVMTAAASIDPAGQTGSTAPKASAAFTPAAAATANPTLARVTASEINVKVPAASDPARAAQSGIKVAFNNANDGTRPETPAAPKMPPSGLSAATMSPGTLMG